MAIVVMHRVMGGIRGVLIGNGILINVGTI